MKFKRLEMLSKEGENDPDFQGRMTYWEDSFPPVRAYIHNSFSEVVAPGIGLMTDHITGSIANDALEHLLALMDGRSDLIEGAHYLLAAVWGEDGNKMVDLFTASEIEDWPDNPASEMFVFKNGVYNRNLVSQRTCGDMRIVVGDEERHRRTTGSLIEYIENPPQITGLKSIGRIF